MTLGLSFPQTLKAMSLSSLSSAWEVWVGVRTGRLTLQDTMNMVKMKMRLALDTGSQRVCWRVKRTAPYRLALVGLEG